MASTSCQTALLDLLLCVFQGLGSFTLIKGYQFSLSHQTQHLFSGTVFICNSTILACTFLSDTFSLVTSLMSKGLHSIIVPHHWKSLTSPGIECPARTFSFIDHPLPCQTSTSSWTACSVLAPLSVTRAQNASQQCCLPGSLIPSFLGSLPDDSMLTLAVFNTRNFLVHFNNPSSWSSALIRPSPWVLIA